MSGFDPEVIRRSEAVAGAPALGAFQPIEKRLAAAEKLERRRAALDGDVLLADVVAFLRRFVIFVNAHQAAAIALWVAHSHAIESAEVSPRLHIRSPERRCGKSRLVDLLELLVAAPLVVVNLTEAALFRTLAEGPRTLLHDEIDAVFGPKAPEHEGLRALINAGHQRGRTVARMEPHGRGFKMVEFPCFAATALAGIGDLPHTVSDRSIDIRLQRRLGSETVERFRRRAVAPEAQDIRERVAMWAERNAEHLRVAWPDLPVELDDRAADGWEPLFAIADLAGGVWPKRARAAAVALHGAGQPVADESLALQLLASVREVFTARGEEHGLWTKDELLPALNALEDAPWGAWNDGKGLNAHRLGKYLRQYENVLPQTFRKGDRTLRGYLVSDLTPHWERYLKPPASPEPGLETQQRNNPCGTTESGRIGNATADAPLRFENGTFPYSGNGCGVVADENPEQGTPAETEVDLAALEEPPAAALCTVCREPCHPAHNPHPSCTA